MIDPASCLSDRLGSLGPRVETLSRDYARVWRTTPAGPFSPDRLYLAAEKKQIERELSALISRLSAEKKNLSSAGPAWEQGKLEEFIEGLRPYFKRLLGRLDLRLDRVYDSRFLESTRRFLQTARNFDPEIGITSVYQALRNVWIMNTLQFYLGKKVESTDAIFGYSMVYPYLDNFFDDAKRSEPEKLGLAVRLKEWLEGADRRPETHHEQKLHALISLIEREFPRGQFPGVFPSLLAILNAQVKSLLQQQEVNTPDPAEILAISLEKGGTSVLADGYLVAGNLEPGQQDFCFGFGTFLQLADDLQDVEEDLEHGHRTVFSSATGKSPLDLQVYRLCRFVSAVVERTLTAARAQEQALKELIPQSCVLMYMESVGKHPSLFSRPCVRGFQKAFPVRFSYLRKIRRSLPDAILAGHKKIRDLDPLSAALMAVSSRAFTLD